MGGISSLCLLIKWRSRQGIGKLMPFLFVLVGCAQPPGNGTSDYFKTVRPAFTGKQAYATTDYVEDYWRVAGNTGFNNTVYLIADTLEASGYVLESAATPGSRLTYRIEKRAMDHHTWEPVSASLQILGQDGPLLISKTNRNMTYLNSASTPENGVKAEVVPITSVEELENRSVRDKIIVTELAAHRLLGLLEDKGALGIITYNNPAYLQPEKNSTSIQFRSLPPQDSSLFWGIALSHEAKEKLVGRMQKGKTEVLVHIQTRRYPSEELTIIANIKGAELPEERLVFSAHIQEPGANDNASGVGVQLEMATTAAKLLAGHHIGLKRSLTFLWGDEIRSTQRYIQEDTERAKGIKWGISLDMVGENTAVTGGSFLIEKMPDPSAIWTRGADKHTEWGGKVLSLDAMKPHYLNDFILSTFKAQGAYADWEVNTNPFEGGSDHTPFLRADIPGILLWHFTDRFYHTDNDRIDKVSRETLKNVGTAALVSALELVNADADFALEQLETLKVQALKRLSDEFRLGKKAIRQGAEPAEEVQVLQAWEAWYLESIRSLSEVTDQTDAAVKKSMAAAQKEIASTSDALIRALARTKSQ